MIGCLSEEAGWRTMKKGKPNSATTPSFDSASVSHRVSGTDSAIPQDDPTGDLPSSPQA